MSSRIRVAAENGARPEGLADPPPRPAVRREHVEKGSRHRRRAPARPAGTQHDRTSGASQASACLPTGAAAEGGPGTGPTGHAACAAPRPSGPAAHRPEDKTT